MLWNSGKKWYFVSKIVMVYCEKNCPKVEDWGTVRKTVKKETALLVLTQIWNCFKDKSPKVPFNSITSSYSYFEEFKFLRQFSKKQNMIKKKYQLNRNEKCVDKAQQCFAFLHIKPKFKFAVQWSWFLET